MQIRLQVRRLIPQKPFSYFKACSVRRRPTIQRGLPKFRV